MYVYGGTWEFTLGDANGNDLSMDAGSIFLEQGASITVGQYTQTAGTFNIEDDNETFRATATAYFITGLRVP